MDKEWSIIINNPNRPWNFSRISMRYTIPFKILVLFKDQLDWKNISRYRRTTVEEILSTVDTLPWDYSQLSVNLELFHEIKKDVRTIET